MPPTDDLPLLTHPLDKESAFTPEPLLEAVRAERGVEPGEIPKVCVLDFDGDLTDWLARTGRSSRARNWACFHTSMEVVEIDGAPLGVVGRTIGGPYAVLVAEQMLVSGADVIVGLTSAGRVSDKLPLPSLVVPTRALRDEGTSFHYLPPASWIDAPEAIARLLAEELADVGLPISRGSVWTTDAPYRETAAQLEQHAARGILAVEMQAASLFALAKAKQASIGVVAHLTNATDHDGDDFDKGHDELSFEILKRISRAGRRVGRD